MTYEQQLTLPFLVLIVLLAVLLIAVAARKTDHAKELFLRDRTVLPHLYANWQDLMQHTGAPTDEQLGTEFMHQAMHDLMRYTRSSRTNWDLRLLQLHALETGLDLAIEECHKSIELYETFGAFRDAVRQNSIGSGPIIDL